MKKFPNLQLNIIGLAFAISFFQTTLSFGNTIAEWQGILNDQVVSNNNWTFKDFASSNVTSPCNGTTLVGGDGIFIKNSYMYKKFYLESPHQAIKLSLRVFLLDNLKTTDYLQIFADNDQIVSISPQNRLSNPVPDYLKSLCGSNNQLDYEQIITKKFLHSGSTLDLKISSAISSTSTPRSLGFRELQLTLIECGKKCEQIKDLHGNFTNADLTGWSLTNFYNNSTNVTICGNQSLLGGQNLQGKNSLILKTYSIPSEHYAIHLSIRSFWIDSIDSNEYLSVSVDGSKILNEDTRRLGVNICGNPMQNSQQNQDDDRTIGNMFSHSKSTLALNISNLLNQAPDDESMGVREIVITVFYSAQITDFTNNFGNSSINGWNLKNFNNSSPITTCLGLSLLGGSSIFGANSYFSKTFTINVPHYAIGLSIRAFFIGNLDSDKITPNHNDTLIIQADGKVIHKETPLNSEILQNITKNYGFLSSICGSDKKDQDKIIQVNFEHSSPSLTINITSLIDADDNESQAFRELEITVFKCLSNCTKFYDFVDPIQGSSIDFSNNNWTARNVNGNIMNSSCGDKKVMGGYNIFSSRSSFIKNFIGIPEHFSLDLKITVYFIDSLDNSQQRSGISNIDYLNIYADDILIIEDDPINTQVMQNYSANPGYLREICGKSFLDQIKTFYRTFIHNSDTLNLTLYSHADMNPDNESYAFREIEIAVNDQECYYDCSIKFTVCPDGFYLKNDKCFTCNPMCLLCDSSLNCTVCKAYFYKLNSTCVDVCPKGYYAKNQQCFPCASPCATCAGNETNCASCISQFYFENSSKSCATCNSSACFNCDQSPSNCTGCNDTSYLYNQACVNSCPNGYFINGKQCDLIDCSFPCLSCISQTSYCLACAENYTVYNKTCFLSNLSCPFGYFQPNQHIKTCQICDNSCLTCENISTNCTSCNETMLIANNSCYYECPDSFFSLSDEFICRSCNFACQKCSQDQNNCQACKPGFALFNNTCLVSCPDGQFEEQGECMICNSSCTKCEGNANNCTLCSINLSLLNNSCVEFCPDPYFEANVSIRSCLKCNETCASCSGNSKNCSKCIDGMRLINSTCADECKEDQIFVNGSCQSCNSTCATCRGSPNNCESCKIAFAFQNNSCLIRCPIGQFNNSTNCSQCDSQCNECNSSNYCLSCIEKYVLIANHSCIFKETTTNNTSNFTVAQIRPILSKTPNPLIYIFSLSDDCPDFYTLFCNISFTLSIEGLTNQSFNITKSNDTQEIKIYLDVNSSIIGTEEMNIKFLLPVELETNSLFNFTNKTASIILSKYYLTPISQETVESIQTNTKITETFASTSSQITDVLMAVNNIYFFGFTLSMLFAFSKFLPLCFPTNLIESFQVQAKNSYSWTIFIIRQNENDRYPNAESKWGQYQQSPYSWNNTYEFCLKLGLFLILYIAFSLIDYYKNKPDISEVMPLKNNEKEKVENKPKIQQTGVIYFLKKTTFKFLHLVCLSYVVVILIASLVNFNYVSFGSVGGIISFILCFAFLWIIIRTTLISFVLNYRCKENPSLKDEEEEDDLILGRSSLMGLDLILTIAYKILYFPTKREFFEKKDLQKFCFEEYKFETQIGCYFQAASLLRLIIFGFLIVYLPDSPIVTIAFSLFCTLSLLIVSIFARPFNTKLFLIETIVLELINTCFFAALLVLWIFDYTNNDNGDSRSMLGWVLIVINSLMRYVPILFLLFSISLYIWDEWKKCKENKQEEKESLPVATADESANKLEGNVINGISTEKLTAIPMKLSTMKNSKDQTAKPGIPSQSKLQSQSSKKPRNKELAEEEKKHPTPFGNKNLIGSKSSTSGSKVSSYLSRFNQKKPTVALPINTSQKPLIDNQNAPGLNQNKGHSTFARTQIRTGTSHVLGGGPKYQYPNSQGTISSYYKGHQGSQQNTKPNLASSIQQRFRR